MLLNIPQRAGLCPDSAKVRNTKLHSVYKVLSAVIAIITKDSMLLSEGT